MSVDIDWMNRFYSMNEKKTTILFGIFSHNVHELDYHLDRRRRMSRRIVRNNIDKHNVHEELFCEFSIELNECFDVDFEDELELIRV